MNNKEISFSIALIFFVLFIFMQIKFSNNKFKSDCHQVFINSFYCKIINKEKDTMDHGLEKLYCIDLKSNSSFIFYPYDVLSDISLYKKTEVGDTLVKGINLNYFMVLNSNKTDSFYFRCND